jgi:hypothetical protein
MERERGWRWGWLSTADFDDRPAQLEPDFAHRNGRFFGLFDWGGVVRRQWHRLRFPRRLCAWLV